MGVDLTLLPVSEELRNGDLVSLYAFNLDLNRVIAPFHQMAKHPVAGQVYWPIEPMPDTLESSLTESLPWLGGPLQGAMFGRATEIGLKFIHAVDVRMAFEGFFDDPDVANDVERAAIAYISCLRPKTKIILYWW